MNRSVVYFVVNLAAFGLLLYFKQPLAALFFVLAVFNALQAFSSTHEPTPALYSGPLGVIGHYDVDGDGEESLGLYIRLFGKPVFVDVREDSLVQERIRHASNLFVNSAVLERSLESFLQSNPVFRKRSVDSIGLHAKDLEQAEVFWEPEGYTLLKGLEFQQDWNEG
jgi:hypothetical protein